MDFIPLVKYFLETQPTSFVTFILRSFLTCEGCEGFQSNINVGELSLTESSPGLQQARLGPGLEVQREQTELRDDDSSNK